MDDPRYTDEAAEKLIEKYDLAPEFEGQSLLASYGLHTPFLERFRWPEFEKLEDSDWVLSTIERARKGLDQQ